MARGEANGAASDANLSKGSTVVIHVRGSSENHGATNEGLGAGEIGISDNVELGITTVVSSNGNKDTGGGVGLMAVVIAALTD